MTRVVPARESERLDALRRLAILDTEPEPHFDAVCCYAREFFRMPIAYIAFLDESRQWLKAACGLALSSVPREETICSKTILFDRLLVVNDADKHPRLCTNVFVVGPPFIRFYAGAPLTLSPGARVGTLCVIDTAPREFSAEQIRSLQGLAEKVVTHLLARVESNNLNR